jgi:hypothetical protein
MIAHSVATMATFEDVKRAAADLPEVAESTSYGTPSLTVRGKSFCRMWGDREHDRDKIGGTEVLVVYCDVDEKDALIESAGGVLFSTPHYDGYGAMLPGHAVGRAAGRPRRLPGGQLPAQGADDTPAAARRTLTRRAGQRRRRSPYVLQSP